VAAALLLGALPAAASAATPAQYRSRVNAVCRGYTARLVPLNTAIKQAQKAHDAYNWGRDLGAIINLGLAQDAEIRSTAVPAGMSTTVGPILDMLRRVDTHAQLALLDAASGSTAWLTEMATIGKLSRPLNTLFDRAGLRDCGSNQP
jgi:hypothetical protein